MRAQLRAAVFLEEVTYLKEKRRENLRIKAEQTPHSTHCETEEQKWKQKWKQKWGVSRKTKIVNCSLEDLDSWSTLVGACRQRIHCR